MFRLLQKLFGKSKPKPARHKSRERADSSYSTDSTIPMTAGIIAAEAYDENQEDSGEDSDSGGSDDGGGSDSSDGGGGDSGGGDGGGGGD